MSHNKKPGPGPKLDCHSMEDHQCCGFSAV
jgi:hypothetical protein